MLLFLFTILLLIRPMSLIYSDHNPSLLNVTDDFVNIYFKCWTYFYLTTEQSIFDINKIMHLLTSSKQILMLHSFLPLLTSSKKISKIHHITPPLLRIILIIKKQNISSCYYVIKHTNELNTIFCHLKRKCIVLNRII